MQLAKRLIAMILSTLMLMSVLSGCADREEQEEGRFVLRASVCRQITSLDPAMNTDARAESVFRALYENLMRTGVDEEGKPVVLPGIAKGYEETENADGTVEYAFTLRSSARWSDGKRIRARDFAYAWRRLVDPLTGSPNHDMLSMVQGYDIARETGDLTQFGVKADGDSVFRVTLSAPCAYFLPEVCTAVATMPLRSDAVQSDPEWTSTTSVLCSGPYRIGVWAKDEYIQLRRNSSYYENRTSGPELLRFVFAADAEKAWALYEDGKLDYVASPPEGAEGIAYRPLRATTCVFYNHMSDVFSNAHVRSAFDLTLSRAAVAAAASAGAVSATGLVPPGIVDVSADAPEDFRTAGGTLCAVDPEGYEARCLKSETELRNGGYWGGAGFPSVKCLYVAGDQARAVAAAAVAVWNEKLRVSVTTEGVSREEFDRRVREGEYELAIDTLSARLGDPMEFLAPFAGTDGENALHYASRPFDLLIGVTASTQNATARTAFLHDAEALLLGDTALSPICFGAEPYVLRDGITGVYFDQRGNVCFTEASRAETAR